MLGRDATISAAALLWEGPPAHSEWANADCCPDRFLAAEFVDYALGRCGHGRECCDKRNAIARIKLLYSQFIAVAKSA